MRFHARRVGTSDRMRLLLLTVGMGLVMTTVARAAGSWSSADAAAWSMDGGAAVASPAGGCLDEGRGAGAARGIGYGAPGLWSGATRSWLMVARHSVRARDWLMGGDGEVALRLGVGVGCRPAHPAAALQPPRSEDAATLFMTLDRRW